MMKRKKTNRNRFKGCLLEILAFILAAIVYQVIVASVRAGDMPFFARLTIIVAMILLLMPILKLALKARKLRAQPRIEKEKSNIKPEVIYLRPFKYDQPLSRFRFTFSKVVTYEEQITQAFSDFGNVFAINQPNEELHELGAYRFDTELGDWQNKIIEMISSARLVVLLAGDSPGILWELSLLLSLDDLTKVVILVPFGRNRYNRMRDRIAEEVGFLLPLYEAGRKCAGDLVGLIYFTPDRKPHYTKLNHIFSNISKRAPLIPVLKMALEPVYRQLDMEWKKPSFLFWRSRVKPVLVRIAAGIFIAFLLLLMLLLSARGA